MIVQKASLTFKGGFFIKINIFGALFAIGFFVPIKHCNSPIPVLIFYSCLTNE